MVRFLKSVLGVVFFLFERVRGPKTVDELKRVGNEMGCLKGFSIRGYEIAIYCQRKEYRVRYARRWIPDRVEVTYNVFSVVSGDAPVALQRACERNVDLPALIHNWNFDNEIRRAQVLAYLDLLEKRLMKNEASST